MKRLLIASLAWFPLVLTAADNVAFWSEGEMIRVQMEAPPQPVEDIVLCAPRNGHDAFQVVVRALPELQAQSQISISTWQGPESSSLPQISLFQEHYVSITTSSPHAPFPAGDFADPLIPTATGKFFALPTDSKPPVGIASNQPWWLEVFVPKTATPGTYRAAISLQIGTQQHAIPITLTVWPVTLPDQPTLRSAFGCHWGRIADIQHLPHNGHHPALRRMALQYHDLLASHHLTPEPLDPLINIDADGTIRDLTLEEYEHRFHEQHATSLPVPLSATWPFAHPLTRDRSATIRYLASFMRIMKEHGWDRFCYLDCPVDEPANAEDYALVRAWGKLCDEAEQACGTHLPMLCTEQPIPTQAAWGSLVGAVDLWSPYLGDLWQHSEQTRQRQAAGEEVWTYVAMVQYPPGFLKNNADHPLDHHPPAWLLDFAPMNYRITAWHCAANNWRGLLYWDTIHWPTGVNPWIDPGTFREGAQVYNGDGYLVYPTADGPVPSLRLKWLRASFEDHALIQLARDSGMSTLAEAEVRKIAPGIADWAADAASLLDARHRLGQALSVRPPQAFLSTQRP